MKTSASSQQMRKRSRSKLHLLSLGRTIAFALIVEVSVICVFFDVLLDSTKAVSKKSRAPARIKVFKSPTSSPFQPTTIVNRSEPVIIRFRDNTKKHKLEDVQCAVPCKVWPAGTATSLNPVAVDNSPFHFEFYSMEGPVIYPSLLLPPKGKRSYDLYATTSFQSDIPLSYYSPDLYNVQAPAVDFDSSIHGASFIASNCHSYSGREEIVGKLINSKKIRVDSLSKCLWNAKPPEGVPTMKNKTAAMERYLFNLAIENQVYDDYITEKLWGALASGILPVYLGPNNIADHHLPPKSVIFVRDFKSINDLAEHLAKLSQNKTLYDSYHLWRKKPLPEAFLKKYEFTKVHSYCRMCQLIYAKRHDLDWDTQLQTIRNL